MDQPKFLPGDVVFFRDNSITGKLIRKFQTSRDEGPTEVNHVGIMCSGTELVEALATIRKNPILKYIGDPKSCSVYVFRLQEMSPFERHRLGAWAIGQVGKWYAPLKIGAYLGDWLVNWPFKSDVHIFRRLISSSASNLAPVTG